MSKSPDPTPQPPAADPNLTKPWPQTQHSPEPWTQSFSPPWLLIRNDEHNPGVLIAHVFCADAGLVHPVFGNLPTGPECDANAKLFLAAPRLLRLAIALTRDPGKSDFDIWSYWRAHAAEAENILRELGVRP